MDVRSAIQTFEQAVWHVTPIAQLAVIGTLVVRKIIWEFKIFALYLTVDILRSIVLWWLGGDTSTPAYRIAWVATEPVYLCLQVFVVLEFYWLLYRAYPGIQAFGRVLLAVAVALALAVTFGTLQFDVGRIVWKVPDMQRLFIAKRLVSSLMGVLMFTTIAFFPRAPSARNILWHGWLLTVFFIAAAGGFFGINYGIANQWAGALFMTAQLGCFVLWSLKFRSRYEKAPAPSPEEVARAERWNKDFLHLARWLVN
ncbi:MAG TPA: hypothetical protein VIX89_04675 [Bryobacteraceae bacterium]